MYSDFIGFVKKIYGNKEYIGLHEPIFIGNEKKYLNECIDSTFVSSVGKFVNLFEEMIAELMGVKYAIATVNGTAALHISLLLAGVETGDEVITQSLTFVATCNAIKYCNAEPVFVDVDMDTMGLSPTSLRYFLEHYTYHKNSKCFNKITNKRIQACMPMHTFGHACRIEEIKSLCAQYNIKLVEDAAEAVGSKYKSKPLGSFGVLGAISFNGNKIITAGGGGAILTDDEYLAKKAKHLTTTAKIPHKWAFEHDFLGYNYRMPNINAALICAQLEKLSLFLDLKRQLANSYNEFFSGHPSVHFIKEPTGAASNYWLNAVSFQQKSDALSFLEQTNKNKVMTRPIWKLMHHLKMYNSCFKMTLDNSSDLSDLIINIPSGLLPIWIK